MTDDLYDLTTPPPVGDPVDRVMRRVARNSRRRAAVAVAAVAVVVAAIPLTARSFVADPRPKQVPTTTVGGVVPFAFTLAAVDSSAPPARVSTGADLPACEARDLQLVVARADRGRYGAATAAVTATNTGADCGLGSQDASVTTEAGDAVPEVTLVAAFDGEFRRVLKVAHGAALGGDLTWTNWCGADPGRWHALLKIGSTTAEQTVPDGSVAPTCATAKQDSFVGVALTLVNQYGQPLDDPQQVLESRITGPATAHLGEILRMTLRLTNPSRGPVSLTPCPHYGLGWLQNGEASATPTLLLNCPAAPDAIPAGGYVDFALELPITPALSSLGKPTTAGIQGGVVISLGKPSDDYRVTVLADEPPVRTGSVECLYGVTRSDDSALTPPAPEVDRAAVPRTGVISTTHGDVAVDWDQDAPCSVTSLLDTARQGFWGSVPGVAESDPRFPVITFGHTKTAGYLMREEIPGYTTYPVGTVLFRDDDPGVHGPDELQVVLGPVPYTPVFTVVGHVTAGLDHLKGAVAITGIR